MRVGCADFCYEAIEKWGQLPSDWGILDITGVAVDSKDRVYAFSRSEHPVSVFDDGGQLLTTWGDGVFKRPHGIFIGPGDTVYCVDDWGHAVHKFTAEGKLLLSIERAKQGTHTGFVWNDPSTIRHSCPPFNFPTDVALSPQGELYVSDGYGNARVHKFTPDGQLMFSWGEPGNGPGEFMTVHDVCVDQAGSVYVADRENSRIQVFTPDGKFVTQWRDLRRPNMMCLDRKATMYITEMGRSLNPSARGQPNIGGLPGRITVRDLTGSILAEWGSTDPSGRDVYFAPHGIAINSRGDLYVSEVSGTFSRGAASADRSVLHKFVRI